MIFLKCKRLCIYVLVNYQNYVERHSRMRFLIVYDLTNWTCDFLITNNHWICHSLTVFDR